MRLHETRHHIINHHAIHNPLTAPSLRRTLPHPDHNTMTIAHTRSHTSSRIIRLATIEKHHKLIGRINNLLRVLERIENLRSSPRILTASDLIEPLTPRLRRRILRIKNRIQDLAIGIKPHRIATNRAHHARSSLDSQRSLSRSLQTVIHQPVSPLLSLITLRGLPRLTRPLSNTIAARNIRITNRQLTRRTLRHPRFRINLLLSRVTVNRAQHVMTAIRLNPILSLILNNQSRATTLDSVIGSRNRLKLARIPQRPHILLTHLKPIILTGTLRNQPRKQLHRVLGLIL